MGLRGSHIDRPDTMRRRSMGLSGARGEALPQIDEKRRDFQVDAIYDWGLGEFQRCDFADARRDRTLTALAWGLCGCGRASRANESMTPGRKTRHSVDPPNWK